MKLHQLLIPLATILLATSCSPPKPTAFKSSDERINYQGRIDFTDTKSPEIVWQGSAISAEFEGPHLSLLFSGLQGQVFFDLTIDGQTHLLKAENGSIPAPIKLSDGKHSLTLFKRSEASAGTVRFDGIEAQSLLPYTQKTFERSSNYQQAPRDEKAQKYLFFGDSITAGACNEDGETDQWDDRSTHNNALSYGALTAKAMNAEYQNIAVSGMGISVGYTEHTFPEIWNKTKIDPNAPIADLASYQPDVLFINLGENDDSFSKNNGNGSFPIDYTSRYIAMVRDMRAAYPDSKIVILRGGMYGGSQSLRLRGPWSVAVETLEATDSNLTHYVFKQWSGNHPRVPEHQLMADELIEWLRNSSH